MKPEFRIPKTETARQDLRAFHLNFGFRYSFDIRHSDFVIVQSQPGSAAARLAEMLPMNLGWFGVPPLGGSNGLGRLKPGLQAVRGSWSQCATKKACRLPMNRCLAGI